MTRGRLAVHGHFYQPERRDPFSGELPAQPAAAPFRDWNERIDAECYRPLGERGTLRHASFDLGPTLGAWLAERDPATLAQFVAADRPADRSPALPADSGNAMAQAYHHAILPLAAARDRRTEIAWGLRDFQLRFGHPAAGMWLPETAIDLPTLRAVAQAGVRYTILAPWQAADPNLDTRRPYRVELGGGWSMVVVFYDGALSASVSFEPGATVDADRFARQAISPRLAAPWSGGGQAPLALIATDGELYGHHQPFRDLFLAHLVDPGPDEPDRGYDVVSLADVLASEGAGGAAFPTTAIVERTSWSCHHGIARWHTECPDASDGRWKAPLRYAMERLGAAIDTVCAGAMATLVASPNLWAARDEYVDVVNGAEPAAAFSARWLGDAAPTDDRRAFLQLLEAQRWRLAMFASDGWFWDDPVRGETRQVLLAAARAVRLVDEHAGTRIEERFVEDLALFASPSRRVDGAAIYRESLAAVGQSA